MFAIANTEIKWAEFLKEKGITGEVNFWTPTDWRIWFICQLQDNGCRCGLE